MTAPVPETFSHIDFRWERDAEDCKRLVIQIDDQDFIEIIRQVEMASARADHQQSLAGSYAGLDGRVESPTRHFLGSPESLYDYDGRTEVLVCAGCHEPGCWPLLVRIEVLDATVRWTDFSQPHRPHWSYSSLRELVFAREQYVAALHRLVERG